MYFNQKNVYISLLSGVPPPQEKVVTVFVSLLYISSAPTVS
jgi:hypothetical protein